MSQEEVAQELEALRANAPTPGRIVNFHEEVDGRDWPAMILEVSGGPILGEGIDAPTGARVQFVIPEPWVAFLQVFRPRGNHWGRHVEGDRGGQWSWPERQGNDQWLQDLITGIATTVAMTVATGLVDDAVTALNAEIAKISGSGQVGEPVTGIITATP